MPLKFRFKRGQVFACPTFTNSIHSLFSRRAAKIAKGFLILTIGGFVPLRDRFGNYHNLLVLEISVYWQAEYSSGTVHGHGHVPGMVLKTGKCRLHVHKFTIGGNGDRQNMLFRRDNTQPKRGLLFLRAGRPWRWLKTPWQR